MDQLCHGTLAIKRMLPSSNLARYGLTVGIKAHILDCFGALHLFERAHTRNFYGQFCDLCNSHTRVLHCEQETHLCVPD